VGVDFKPTSPQEAFREEIRGFLRSELGAEAERLREDGCNILRSIIAHRGLGLPAD
jgi:hypothetical protein